MGVITPLHQQLDKQGGANDVNVYNSNKKLNDGHKWNTMFYENGKVLSQDIGTFWKVYNYFVKRFHHSSENNSHFWTKK